MVLIRKFYDKYHHLSIQAKASLWFVLCSFLQKGVSFITIPIFTRLLSVDEYGLTNLFNTWSSILILFATLNLSGGVYNRGLLEFNEKKYTSTLQSIETLCSVIVIIVVLVFKEQFVKFSGLSLPIIVIMCAHFIFVAGFNLWTVKERFFYRYKKLVAFSVLNTVLSTSFGLLAVLLCHEDKGEAKIIWSTFALILVSLPFYIYNFVSGKTIYNKEMWKFSLAFNIPLLPHYLSNLILNQSDRIMINWYFGKSEVAYYSVAYSVASIIRIFVDAINQTLTPWRYQSLKKERYHDINRVSIIILLMIGLLVTLVNLFAPEIIYLFGGEKYIEAIWVIPPIMLSVYFIYLYGMFSSIEFYYLKTKFMMVASLISAILNIVLNYIFIQNFGYISCAYTSLFCYIVYTVCHYLYMIKVSYSEINIKSIFDEKIILAISLITCGLTFSSMLLYKYTIPRYVILIGSIMIVVVNYNKLTILLKEVKNEE